MKKRLLIFASGDKSGGGSGAVNLVYRSIGLDYKVVGVVSNHENGGVKRKIKRLNRVFRRENIPFIYFGTENSKARYREIVEETKPDFVALSGWLWRTKGLDPAKTINIHPAILPETKGLYGHFAHEKVIELGLKRTAVTMHFVTKEYDDGPIIFQNEIGVLKDDTSKTLQRRVNREEHLWQPMITNLVAQGKIKWDGKNPESLIVPNWYNYLKLTESVTTSNT